MDVAMPRVAQSARMMGVTVALAMMNRWLGLAKRLFADVLFEQDLFLAKLAVFALRAAFFRSHKSTFILR